MIGFRQNKIIRWDGKLYRSYIRRRSNAHCAERIPFGWPMGFIPFDVLYNDMTEVGKQADALQRLSASGVAKLVRISFFGPGLSLVKI